MEYIQNNIQFNFKLIKNHIDENIWFSKMILENDFFIEIFIKDSLFNSPYFNWDNVKYFTNFIYKNLKFIFEKAKIWNIALHSDNDDNKINSEISNIESYDFEDEITIFLNEHYHSDFYQFDIESYSNIVMSTEPYCSYISKFDCQNGTPYFWGILRKSK